MLGIDYAWGQIPGKIIKNAGYDYVCRYLSHTESKNLKLSELNDFKENNLKLVVVWETTEERALDGYDAGVQDAKSALDILSDLGITQPVPIYFAIDTDTTGVKVKDYFLGIASIISTQYIGAYGGYLPINYLFNNNLITYGWQTLAWSYGKWESRAQIQQYDTNTHILNHVSVDYNRSPGNINIGSII